MTIIYHTPHPNSHKDLHLPDSVKWYHLLGMSVTWGTKEAYNYTLSKTISLQTNIASSLSPTPPLNPPKMPINPLFLEAPAPRFHLFGSLPPEIRAQIWAHACSQPRTIEILQSRSGPILSSPYSSAPIPAPLHVSREARGEALIHYQLAFTNTLTASPGIYVNFAFDAVFFGHRCDFFALLKSSICGFLQGLNEIRYLAVAALRYREIGNWDFDVLKEVQEIVLTAHDGTLELVNANGREMELIRGQEVLGLEWEGRWWELPGEVYSTVKALEMALNRREEQGKGRPVVRGGVFAGAGKVGGLGVKGWPLL